MDSNLLTTELNKNKNKTYHKNQYQMDVRYKIDFRGMHFYGKKKQNTKKPSNWNTSLRDTKLLKTISDSETQHLPPAIFSFQVFSL